MLNGNTCYMVINVTCYIDINVTCSFALNFNTCTNQKPAFEKPIKLSVFNLYYKRWRIFKKIYLWCSQLFPGLARLKITALYILKFRIIAPL